MVQNFEEVKILTDSGLATCLIAAATNFPPIPLILLTDLFICYDMLALVQNGVVILCIEYKLRRDTLLSKAVDILVTVDSMIEYSELRLIWKRT